MKLVDKKIIAKETIESLNLTGSYKDRLLDIHCSLNFDTQITYGNIYYHNTKQCEAIDYTVNSNGCVIYMSTLCD